MSGDAELILLMAVLGTFSDLQSAIWRGDPRHHRTDTPCRSSAASSRPVGLHRAVATTRATPIAA
jgi:hypothetical protein